MINIFLLLFYYLISKMGGKIQSEATDQDSVIIECGSYISKTDFNGKNSSAQ